MSTPRSLFLKLFVAMLVVTFTAPPFAAAQEPRPIGELREEVALWETFMHNITVAQPDRASVAWEALEGRVSDMELLEITEASPRYDFEQRGVREFIMGHDELREIGQAIQQRLDSARLERATDEEHILNAIDQLDRGRRPNMLATRVLVEAGQYAVPHLLEALQQPPRPGFSQFALRAMTAIGRPAAYPLAVALPHLEHTHQIHIAHVLADIGYAGALPYLAVVLEDEQVTPSVHQSVQASFNLIARTVRMPERTRAADLFLWQARRLYEAGTIGETVTGLERRAEVGLIWEYRSGAGLLHNEVPAAAHPDIRSMFAAMAALRHDRHLDAAVTRFLLANARRELRLDGASDPSYPFPQPAGYYLRLAGARQQLPVLRQAMEDQDTALARQIIAALGDTGSPADLLAEEAGVRPVLMAMSHPNRRIRIEMNLALARLTPQRPFEGASRVVPALAEAIALDAEPVAAVVTATPEEGNALAAFLDERGYTVLRAGSISELSAQLREVPGVDVVVSAGRVGFIKGAFDATVRNHRLAATPFVAHISALDWAEVTRRYRDVPRLIHADALPARTENDNGDQDAPRINVPALEEALEEAQALDPEAEIDREQATAYALEALERLHDIGVRSNAVFDINDARPALLRGLRDERVEIARGAGRVLALIRRDDTQRALADVALDADTPRQVRVSLFNSLADSAARHGNRLSSEQLERLTRLVGDRETTGDLAIAAARALGALQPPTERLRDIIAR